MWKAFARLGSKVTVIEAGSVFLGLEEPEAGAALRPHLESDGITLIIGDPCPAFNRVLGESLEELAEKVALQSPARS